MQYENQPEKRRLELKTTNSYITGCYSSATVINFKHLEELTHVNSVDSNSLSKKYEWLIV